MKVVIEVELDGQAAEDYKKWISVNMDVTPEESNFGEVVEGEFAEAAQTLLLEDAFNEVIETELSLEEVRQLTRARVISLEL